MTTRIPLPALVAALLVALPGLATAQFTRDTGSGLSRIQPTWGAVFSDLDLDGDLDLLAGHHFEDPVFFYNDGNGVFDDTLHEQPWTGNIDRHGMLLVSLDGDRDPDLFVTHGGSGGAGSEANELYRNDGDGNWIFYISAGGMGDPEGRSRSASAADYNGDHRVDVYVAKAPDATSFNSLFRNDQNFWHKDVAGSLGLDENLGTVGGIWGDYDEDGDPDLLVGGEEFERPTVLWRNEGPTGFVDASALFVPPLPVLSGAAWGDFDNDGDLDLGACTGGIGLFDVAMEGDSISFYFNSRYAENGVDGLTIPTTADTLWAQVRIRGVADPSAIILGFFEQHPATASGFPLTNEYLGPPVFTPGVDRGIFIWRSSPNGPFEIRCVTPNFNFDAFDGWFTAETPIVSIDRLDFEDAEFEFGKPIVYRNDGGVFVDVSAAMGLPASLVNPRHVTWVDYDNDGDLDLHVVDKGTSGLPNSPDKLYKNNGASFVDVTGAERLHGGTDGLGDGAVWGDVDGDGDLDMFLMEGDGPKFYSERGPNNLYVNDGDRGPSLQLDLAGRESGAAAIGTKVRVVAAGLVIQRRLFANSWRGFQTTSRIHIGLDGASDADSLIIEWPSGTVDVLTGVPAGTWTLEEGIVTTGIPWSDTPAPGAWELGPARPQPARGPQSIQLTLSHPARLSVTVHDVGGRRVRSLHEGLLPAGARWLVWDGRDDAGRAVSAGVYFVVATDGTTGTVRKSVRLR